MEEIDSKEASDALHMLLHCSLKDKEFETQKEQFEIVSTYIKKLEEEKKHLREYIAYAPNLDEMTATKYQSIQREGYIKGVADAQKKAEQIIYENYIPKSVIEEKIEELRKKTANVVCDEINEIIIKVLQELLEKGNK